MTRLRTVWFSLLFFLLGLPFLNKTGVHFDAAFELGSFYSCSLPRYSTKLFGQTLPLMVIPYLGTFKTWLYWPILHYLEVTPAALRLPTLLLGGVTVWLSYRLLEKIGGRKAAIAGTLLLATDATFLISTAYDFGPVAFLHFFLLAGIALLLRFQKTQRAIYLALAFFLFGVALWHKALFVWMLNGLVVAAVVTCARAIRPMLTIRNLAIAAVSICLGALPLIYYNVETHGETLGSASGSERTTFAQRVLHLRRTMDSSVLFGWLTEEAYPETSVAPQRLVSKVSVAVGRKTGEVRSNWLFYCFVASCCLIPWLWFTPARRAVMFLAIYMAVTWIQMALTPNAGGTMHHVVLLWPFPHFLVAIACVQAAQRFGKRGIQIGAAILGVCVLWNLLLINQLYADLTTRGTGAIWTDAIYPLFRHLDTLQDNRIVTTDWGYATTLCVLSDGEMPTTDISYSLLDPTPKEKEWIATMMADPKLLFVDHTASTQQFPNARAHLDAIAAGHKYVRETVFTELDRNRRTRFEVFRYKPAP